MAVCSEIRNLLVHPVSFFAMKQEEEVTRSLLLFGILSLGVVLSYALTTIIFFFVNPRMTPALFMDLFPGYGLTLVYWFTSYIAFTLGLIILSYLVFRFSGQETSIHRIIIIFCYAQTPLALLIISQFLFTIATAFISRLFTPFFFTLYILPFSPLIGLIWMTIIAIRGFQEFQILTNRSQSLGMAALILVLGFGFLFMQGFLASGGLSVSKLTTKTITQSQSETVFMTRDQNWSQYRNEEMGITFLFPADWKVNTTRTEKESWVSYIITSYNHRKENRSTIGEKFTFGQSLSERSHHYFRPLSVTGSPVGSRSIKKAIASDIAQQIILNYDLLNQSSIQIENKTGTIIHMQLISERSNSYYWGNQSLTMKGTPEVSEYQDIAWIDANGMRYSFHMTSYAAGYDQYRQEFSDILDSIRFINSSSPI
jgi:hypothetical protein